jgi:membrane protease YdiL (CAAX protease family)
MGETTVFGRLFLQRVHHYRVLAKDNGFSSRDIVHAMGTFLRAAATSPASAVVPVYFAALGEEVGWRGLLVPELDKIMSFRKTALISGSIWALWHYPMFSLGGYGAPYGLQFTAMVVGMAAVFAWMRLKSGSVWTGMLLHGTHNLLVDRIFDPTIRDAAIMRHVWGGLGGTLVISTLLAGSFFWRKSLDLPSSGGGIEPPAH